MLSLVKFQAFLCIKPVFKRSSNDWNKQTIFVSLIRPTLLIFLEKYLDRSETRRDRAKITLAGQHDRPRSENYFEPWSYF